MINIDANNLTNLQKLLGVLDANIDTIMNELSVDISVDGTRLAVSGEAQNETLAAAVIDKLLAIIRAGEPIDKTKIIYCIELAREGNADDIGQIMSGVVAITSRGKEVKCKTVGQKQYVNLVKNNQIVFAIGPAGTGKTYLAVAMAVAAYKNKEVEKIILTRPAIEAGEKLGFLPGDLQTKVDPYLRPLYDALQEMFGLEAYQKLLERGVVEVAPLAYMRGRTLNNAVIILDEAQNTTVEQMKMFLTRMGEGSRMLINGDVTQIDLPTGKRSGLVHASKILSDIKGIGIVNLTYKDVVRHPLVMEIIKAYSKFETNEKTKRGTK